MEDVTYAQFGFTFSGNTITMCEYSDSHYSSRPHASEIQTNKYAPQLRGIQSSLPRCHGAATAGARRRACLSRTRCALALKRTSVLIDGVAASLRRGWACLLACSDVNGLQLMYDFQLAPGAASVAMGAVAGPAWTNAATPNGGQVSNSVLFAPFCCTKTRAFAKRGSGQT